ncbi:MAG: CotH kinase family protein [Verrucomicrobiota bacterium]|nr:CotH kinase family protein [Verrucomicrobiota bacterium]
MKPPSKRYSSLAALLTLLAIFFTLKNSATANFAITEIKAVAELSFPDNDGEPSDWIEVTNTGDNSASLEGYYLTNNSDNLKKWQFPLVNLSKGESVVIFASAKNRVNPDEPLHASFTLDRKGDYLALIAPDGVTVVSGFDEGYPEQYPGSSYGYGTSGLVSREVLVASDAKVKYKIPTDDSLANDWLSPSPDFDDSDWKEVDHPVGFESTGGTLEPLVKTNISEDMKGVNASGYFRFPFNFNSTDRRIVSAQLAVSIDDGFVAYLNGERIFDLNAPDPVVFDSRATASRLDRLVVASPEVEDVSSNAASIKEGNNVLAVQAMNRSSGGSDFVIGVELLAEVQDTSGGVQYGFFKEATPGKPNGIIFNKPPSEVVFSSESQLFENDFELSLSTETPGAIIRYTTDLSLPTNEFGSESKLYTGPISINKSTQIRAQTFLPGSLDGPVATKTFLKMSGSVPNFTSNLPIIVMSTLGKGAPPESGSTARKDAFIFFFEPDPETGRASLKQEPQIFTRSGVRKRGSSSSGWPKYGMSVETWNEGDDLDNNIRPFGFAREADWIFNSRYRFDLSLIRNPLIYEISRNAGRYAARSKFVELYNDVSGSELNDSDYFGVYSLMEKIETDPNRVEIDRLMPWDNEGDELTGGYIFKRDRNDAGSPPTYSVGGAGGALIPHDPGGREVTREQKTYIQNYLNEMNAALLNRPSGINPRTGLHFSDYLDVDSFIDHQWLNTLAMNVDWGRLSAYYHKDKGGKVNAGPIWDFDRNMGSEDGRDANPRTWDGSGDSSKTWYDGRYPWFGNLIGPNSNPASAHYPDVRQRHTDRWFELRRTAFSTENIHGIIDRMADEIREAQARSFAKWTGMRPNGGTFADRSLRGWESEISQLKGWMKTRVEWIDSQYSKYTPPELSQAAGIVNKGVELTMLSQNGQVYYTLDGTDPRLEGGQPSPEAIPFQGGPIDTSLINDESSCRYFVPTDNEIGLNWVQADFDDSTWEVGKNGLGYETPNGPLVPYVLTDTYDLMRSPGRASSIYIRYEFDFENIDNVNSLIMRAIIDDGFVAFLNGERVATFQAPDELSFDSRASGSRLDSIVVRESSWPNFDLASRKDLLKKGRNVLAIQAMNTSAGGSDFVFSARLDVNHTVTSEPFILNDSAVVTARAFDGNLWSAPSQATYVIGDSALNNKNLVVSEIMYRPAQETDEEERLGFTDRDDFEFIELLNIDNKPISLIGSSFTDGVDFDFSNAIRTIIQPGERVLLVKNSAAVSFRYGESVASKIIGEFEGSTGLSNDGESVVISNVAGEVVRSFTYNDKLPWPEEADGNGFSLELISPESNPDHDDASNWQLSSVVGGSPGEESPIVEGQTFAEWSSENGNIEPNSDTDNDGRSALVEFAMGTNPVSFEKESDVLSIEIVKNDNKDALQVSVDMNPKAQGITLLAEWSNDLNKWINENVQRSVEILVNNDGNIVKKVTFSIDVNNNLNKPVFFRIKATMP